MTSPSAPVGVSTLTAPINLNASRPPWRQTFSSLKVRNFRIFATAHMVAVIALWMQRIAQDWLVLQLSGSVTAVGITVAMQFAPSLLLMPLGGMIADRYSKRMILMISQGAAGALALAMAVLALTGSIQVWHIYGIAFVLGLVTVVDQPARQVFVNELVGPAQLRNAISVNSSLYQIGAMIGPAISGVLISAVGGGWAFAVNAAACGFTVVMLSCLRPADLLKSTPAPRSKGQLREGLNYALAKPTIFWPTLMAGFIAVFAMSLPVCRRRPCPGDVQPGLRLHPRRHRNPQQSRRGPETTDSSRCQLENRAYRFGKLLSNIPWNPDAATGSQQIRALRATPGQTFATGFAHRE